MQWLWLLIIPILILISIIVFIILKKKIKKFNNFYNELADFLQSEPYNDAKTTLRTIDINLHKIEANKIEEIRNTTIDQTIIQQTIESDQEIIKIKNDKQEFAQDLIEIEDKIILLRKKHKEGCDYLKARNFFKIQKNIFEIKKIKSQINKISNEVDKRVENYVNEIEQINQVLYKYREKAKELLSILNGWKNQKNGASFNQKIDQVIGNLNRINDNLSEVLIKRKTKETKTYFSQYKKILFELYFFANHYDKFKKLLYEDAPNSLNKTRGFFYSLKAKFESDSEYLGIDAYFNKAWTILISAKDAFYNLSINETKKIIKQFYDVLLKATLVMNKELKAYNFLKNNKIFDRLSEFYKNISKRYLEIKKVIDEAIAIDPNYFAWIIDAEDQMNQILNDLGDLKAKIMLEKDDKQFSNLKKQARIKQYILLVQQFNKIHDNIKNEINIFYSEGINVLLIFNRIKHLILALNVRVKKQNIRLLAEEAKLQMDLEAQRQIIDKLILDKNNQDPNTIKLMIEKYQLLAINYLNTVGKKATIIQVYTFLNEKYSYKRINNPSFHKSVLNSEQHFIDGDYETSLKLITKAIKGGIN